MSVRTKDWYGDMRFTFLLTTLWWQLQPLLGVGDVHHYHHQHPLPGASDDVYHLLDVGDVHHSNVGDVGDMSGVGDVGDVHHPNVCVVGEQSADFREPQEVVANDSEITLGLTLLNIKRVKSIADIFQVLP